jgi:hypothetical protein
MMMCPVNVKEVPISTVESPVTQVALITVNKISTAGKSTLWALGRERSKNPNNIIPAKLRKNIKEGFNLLDV